MRWFKAIVAWVRARFARATPVAVVTPKTVNEVKAVRVVTERERVMRVGRRTLARFKKGW